MNGKQNHPPRLGFIGLGAMGSRMAGRLLAAGYELTVFNRSPERIRPLEQRGARSAHTPAEVARNAEIVLVSVADDAAAEAVIAGTDGVLSAAPGGAVTVIINTSTVSPGLSRRLYEAAQNKGVWLLDAPVSGSTPQAEDGKLVIFVGGDRAAYDPCRPVLEVLGQEAFYIGPAGSGSTMKLCVNALLGLGVQALAEAIALGLKAGLSRDAFLDVLGSTVVLSPSQKSKLDNARRDRYPATFPLRLMAKDLGLILETARALSVEMPATTAARAVSAAEAARQRASGRDEDFSSVVRAMQEAAHAARPGEAQGRSPVEGDNG
jgi:3-hydroxyisobutyrate dehydrogenase-like beta-hydroxyacid dehydrogenase